MAEPDSADNKLWCPWGQVSRPTAELGSPGAGASQCPGHWDKEQSEGQTAGLPWGWGPSMPWAKDEEQSEGQTARLPRCQLHTSLSFTQASLSGFTWSKVTPLAPAHTCCRMAERHLTHHLGTCTSLGFQISQWPLTVKRLVQGHMVA